MDKVEFNKYCAEVMGYDDDKLESIQFDDPEMLSYNPFDEANQRHEVFDKLWQIDSDGGDRLRFVNGCYNKGIDKAEREFIWSTKENKSG